MNDDEIGARRKMTQPPPPGWIDEVAATHAQEIIDVAMRFVATAGIQNLRDKKFRLAIAAPTDKEELRLVAKLLADISMCLYGAT